MKMQDLVIMKKGQALCSSLQVAKVFEKEHKNVLRDIRVLLNFEPSSAEINPLNFELVKSMFFKSTYKDEKGEKRPMYYMNRDGFSLLAMGFTGKKALEWKLKYIQAFHRMENTIKKLSSREYLESRKLGKLTRKQTYLRI